MTKDLKESLALAATVLDEFMHEFDPEVRFCVYVWKSDTPCDATSGDVACTTNDVPNARRIMSALSLDGMVDPNAIPAKASMN